jgi:indolepyruvate ferredoxin oxidoreductase alpha subunit
VDRLLLSGNEAIARGAWEAGASFGVGYPGTPSTEVLEAFARFEAVRAQWAPNEKVALEVAAGMSLGGVRVLCTMKHVGMNVAADALMTLSYTGVTGGLVILVADDPGMHSSQNEQDSRNWGPFGKVPILEPADSDEAYRFVQEAFELSERFDTPVLVRSTVRVSHAKGLVDVGERAEHPVRAYMKRAGKWVMMPGNAKVRRVEVAKRTTALTEWAETTPLTLEEPGTADFGIVTAGVSYQYVREVLPDVPVLKLAASWPLPATRLRAFAKRCGRIAVVEELDPYLRTNLRAMGVSVMDEDTGPMGELDPGKVRVAFGLPMPETRQRFDDLPPRPPMLCPGCPHRGVFAALRDMEAVVTGDIGCYTLGALPPLASMDSCVCMGASIGMGYGLGATDSAGERPIVQVIGDSTFAHSGLTGLLHEVYNAGNGTIVILDNRTTAMTGHQGNPVSGKTLTGAEAPALDLVAVCTALGATSVVKINPNNLKRTAKVIAEEVARPGVSVVIAESPCVLLSKRTDETTFRVESDACTCCDKCVQLGCPAIAKDPATLKAVIDPALCIACTQCVQVCVYDAIKSAGPACAVTEVTA